MDAIRGPEFTSSRGRQVRHRPLASPDDGDGARPDSARDGQIHTDSVTKLITVLIYMNGKWESPVGRLRLLRSPDNLNDVVAEVPPDEGTLLVFRNQPNAWHGFEPFEGPRKVIQLELGHQRPRRVVGADPPQDQRVLQGQARSPARMYATEIPRPSAASAARGEAVPDFEKRLQPDRGGFLPSRSRCDARRQ